MTQNLSNISSYPSTNKWGVEKNFLHKSTKTCKINFFCAQLTCTCYGPQMLLHLTGYKPK